MGNVIMRYFVCYKSRKSHGNSDTIMLEMDFYNATGLWVYLVGL